MTEDAKINYEVQKPVGLQVRHVEQVIMKKRRRVIVRPNLKTTHKEPTKGNPPVCVSTPGPTILILEHRCYASRHKRILSPFFPVNGSVHRESMSITVQQDATIYSFIIFSADSSTCFV